MGHKFFARKAAAIIMLLSLLLCLFACSKKEKANDASDSSVTQSANETQMIFETRAQNFTSGTCGAKATWTYDDETHTLIITGTGTVIDESGMTRWAEHTENIVVEDGITDFYGGVFGDFVNVRSIDLPDTLTRINKDDFSETAYYKDPANRDYGVLYIDNYLVDGSDITKDKYTVKSGTVYIGDCAFMDTDISEIVLPDSVTYVGGAAFSNCYSLKSIYIGSGLREFNYDVFEEGTEMDGYMGPYMLEKIVVSEHNKYLSSENGVLYNKEKTTLIWYPACLPLTDFTFPDEVQSLDLFAITKIKNLQTLNLNDGFDLSELFVYGCASLKRINIGKSTHYNEESTIVVDECLSLEYIDVHKDNANYSSVDGVLFNKNKTKIIKYPAGKKSVEYNIPDSVTTIADHTFERVVYLKKLFIGKNVINLEPSSIGYVDYGMPYIVPYAVYYEGTADKWKTISSELEAEPVVYCNSKKFTATKPQEETTKKPNVFDWF